MNKPTPAPFVSNVARHPTRYKFEVFMLDGTRKPDLKRSFLRRLRVDIYASAIVTEDNLTWRIIVDDVAFPMPCTANYDCIVSFQAFHDGERIAVVRPYTNKEQHNG